MTLPSQSDISVYGTLDEQTACEHFFGITTDEAELMFRNDCGTYCEDLMWMGMRAFCFYVRAAIRYVMSRWSKGDYRGVSWFVAAVTFRLDELGNENLYLIRDIVEAVEHILNCWQGYNVDEKIYTELRTECVNLSEGLNAIVNRRTEQET